MNIFSNLSQRVKLLIISSSLFIVSLALGFLVFGSNGLSVGHEFMEAAQSAAKADILYFDPQASAH